MQIKHPIVWCKTHDCRVDVLPEGFVCKRLPDVINEDAELPKPCVLCYKEVA